MFRKAALYIFISATAVSCDSKKELKGTESDTDVAMAFIQSTLKNDIKEAKKYIVNDEQNEQLLQDYSRWYSKQASTKTNAFKNANVVIHSIEPVVADSMEIIYYSNSSEQDVKNKLKLVRVNGQWLIDFKYTVSGNL